eukprot:jgi/Bigna1/130468/aug1.11_g5176
MASLDSKQRNLSENTTIESSLSEAVRFTGVHSAEQKRKRPFGLALRRLYRTPRTAVDWDDEYEERTSEWFELFVDLIMVIAFSRIADFLADEYSPDKISLFILFFTLFQSSWTLYMVYCTRLYDNSFVHTIYLIVFLLGMAGMAIHVGNADLSINFTVAMIVQRTSLCVMYFLTACQNRRAKSHAMIITYVMLCSLVLLLVATVYTANTTILHILWALVVVVEMPFDIYAYAALPRSKLLPLNIDHVTDRQNGFILAVLGESVVSALQDYSGQHDFDRNAMFYLAMMLALLLSFSIALLFYNVQPTTRDQHAFRQSVGRGFFHYFVIICLGPSLLMAGVAIMFVTRATVYHHEMKLAEVTLLFASVGVSLILIFLVRVSHYAGHHPSPDDPEDVKRVKWAWWAVFTV